MRALRDSGAGPDTFKQTRPDMQSTLDTRAGRQQAKPHARRGAVVLALLLGLSAARADTTNFMGAFGEAFWSAEPQSGTVGFSNSDTELVLAGPNQPATAVPLSLDGIVYNGPLGGGLLVGGTMSFHYVYTSSDALSDSEADIAWTAPGGSSAQFLLGQGGPGVVAAGDYTTPLLSAGTTNLTFLLTTDTLANKLSGTLVISDFQFHDVPEPGTGILTAGMLAVLSASRWRRFRGRAAGRS